MKSWLLYSVSLKSSRKRQIEWEKSKKKEQSSLSKKSKELSKFLKIKIESIRRKNLNSSFDRN